MESTHFAVAFLGGLIPVLFWLWFWLREDRKNPEPLLLIAVTFIAGMAVVPIALPLQQYACEAFQHGVCQPANANLVYAWVIIEETLKYAAALLLIFWNRVVDEPIDMIIYMITIALGFAALENALFIYRDVAMAEYARSAISGSFRFIGPTLLHVLASGTLGVVLALTFYHSQWVRLLAGMFGLFMAIVLHALFNFFIMDSQGESILGVFLFVWMGIIVLIILFEKVKLNEYIRTKHQRSQPHL